MELNGQETEVVETEGTEINEGIDPTVPDVEESTETGETPEEGEEKPPEEPEQPEKEDGVQKRINKIHREKKEAEERAEAERQRREELETKLKELQKEELPAIPEIPDYLDDGYEEKMKARDEIIAKHAQEESRKQALAQLEADKIAAENKAHQEKVNGYVKAFDARIDSLGLDKESITKGGEIVGRYIQNQHGLAEYIVSDSENGPLIVQYLSQNLEELEKISTMPVAQAAVHIATKIAPESQKLKPKQTQTPEPPYDPQGNKKVVDDDPILAGATFE